MNNSGFSADDNINCMFDKIESDSKTEQQNILQKLQAIRLWQLKQQEELKKQQQTQLALLKSQSNDKLKSNDNLENDVLAVPLSSYSNHLDTILEQSSLVENVEVADQKERNSVKGEKDFACFQKDLNLMQLNENIPVKENSPLKEVCLTKIAEEADNLKIKSDEYQSDSIDELHSDVESSFEKVSTSQKVSFDEIPVKAGKTFEEMLADQLAQEKIAKPHKEVGASTPKRPFLRKGQGIARFKGPPKKSTFKKKDNKKADTLAADDIKVAIFNKAPSSDSINGVKHNKDDNINTTSTNLISDINNIIGQTVKSNIETKPRPCVRKTARLAKREPLKQLVLKPDFKISPTIDKKKCSEEEFHLNEKSHNESVIWSDVEDTILGLDSTVVNDYNTTSNETFEQMEKFCNEHYADVSSVKTLEEDDSVIMKKIEPLPPNKLMLQLFPSLRADIKKKSEKQFPEKQNCSSKKNLLNQANTDLKKSLENDGITSVSSVSPEPPNHSVILKSKLEEMEAEIKHFQEESAKLSSVRKAEENQLQLLKHEFEEFQRQKEEELNRLSEFKKAEIKKLKKERKLFEDHAAATKSMPNKRDREYIQELENKILDLQNEAKLKEQRLNAINSRLRSQIEVSTDENEELKKKLKELEAKASKLEHEKEIKKNKKSQDAWKAINEIVDAIPVNNENVSIDDYIQSNIKPKDIPSKPMAQPLPLRSPLIDMNGNNKMNTSEVRVHDGKTERRRKDGSIEIAFENGTKKFVFPDGRTEIRFTNGDIKNIFIDGTVKYHYTSSGTWHTTHPNGMQVFEFSNKQVERHFPDGSKHITFEDGSSKMIKLNGSEETIFPDGTVMTVTPTGEKTIEFSNGQREIHTSEFKRREYPDGTCKTVFSDGRQETKYSSGRLRIKDANGTLLLDKMLNT